MSKNFHEIYIYTLGNFLIKKDNKVLASGYGDLNKKWKLFIYLIFKAGEVVSHEELFHKLDLSANGYPDSSLRVLVSRLRKRIDGQGDSLIITRRHGYSFNTEYNFWLDCLQFESLLNRANNSSELDIQQKTELYQQALNLYQGAFLDIENIDPWLLEKRAYYHDLYLENFKKTVHLLEKQKKYHDKFDLYELALRIYPYETDLHLGQYDSLKKMGKNSMARNRAEESVMFLKKAGLDIPEKLKDATLFDFNTDLQLNPEDILKDNNGEDIFVCGPLTFSSIFNLEKRRSERKNRNIYLAHCKLTGKVSPGEKRKAENILYKTLHKNLRSMDVLTRLRHDYFLQLFVDITEKQIEKIFSRINSRFYSNCNNPGVSINWEYQKG